MTLVITPECGILTSVVVSVLSRDSSSVIMPVPPGILARLLLRFWPDYYSRSTQYPIPIVTPVPFSSIFVYHRDHCLVIAQVPVRNPGPVIISLQPGILARLLLRFRRDPNPVIAPARNRGPCDSSRLLVPQAQPICRPVSRSCTWFQRGCRRFGKACGWIWSVPGMFHDVLGEGGLSGGAAAGQATLSTNANRNPSSSVRVLPAPQPRTPTPTRPVPRRGTGHPTPTPTPTACSEELR